MKIYWYASCFYFIFILLNELINIVIIFLAILDLLLNEVILEDKFMISIDYQANRIHQFKNQKDLNFIKNIFL